MSWTSDAKRLPKAGAAVWVNELGSKSTEYALDQHLTVIQVASDGLMVSARERYCPVWVSFTWVNPEGPGRRLDRSVWHLYDVPACDGPGEVAGACEGESDAAGPVQYDLFLALTADEPRRR